ncbi:uncharacterized protein N7479_000610 [Penicillium vulpinum]|uniref:uncharacterized protein n=1 Tax=Penicillium vulpinum TaxID=29845 RepID=UPI0025489BB1|nr:uncharacterized protein N7479_000610 [Penicillium vulpinum]KAJ5970692.1 hypothetical protein N7479_000610 [Penicillium vulpinum]
MADPLSIASGVAGLLSLGIQVTKSLLDFYSAYKDQTPALKKTLRDLESLLSILRSLDGALQNGEPQKDALLQEIDKVAEGCREILEELRDECQKFQKDATLSLKDRIQVAGRRATYPFRKSTLQKLEEDVGEIRGNLSLALNVLQLRNQTGLEDGISELKIFVEETKTIQISAAIRDWLKAPDATIDHNAACEKRHTSTGLWLVNGQKFQNWLVEPNSFLWINGFAGCGKSVICSTTIQAVQHTFRERQHHPNVGIGFFYFTFNDEAKRDSSGMLRALLLQLSAQLEGDTKELQELHTSYKSGTPPEKVLLDCLRQTICKFSVTYIFLDALDESSRDDKREDVLGAIEKIRQWDLPSLHLLVTSRNEIDIRYSLGTSLYQDIPMRNPETDTDIQNFISYQLSNDPKLQRWKSRHEEIQEKLTEKAQGVFRYVECQLLALKRARIRNELDKCLHSLPRDLDETYERMLCSIDEEYAEEARLMLTLLCVSNFPVTVKELVGALTIDVKASELQLDRDGRSFSQDDILDICSGLIELAVIPDTGSYYFRNSVTIVRIAHFSVQEYLESDRITQQGAAKFTVQKEQAHTEMAQICLAYLLDPTLSNGKVDEAKLENFPLAPFAAGQWFTFYKNSGKGKSDVECLISKLFKDQLEAFTTWVRLHGRGSRESLYDILHSEQYLPTDFGRAIKDIPSPLYYAALLGLEYIVSVLIASWGGETAIDADINAQGGVCGNALQAASSGGHEMIVQILLSRGADVNAQGGYFGNALEAASYGGHEKIVQTLLDHGADVNAQGGEYGNPLEAASSGGHEMIVQILLSRGADVNAQGGEYSNALQAASYRGHEKVAQTLLDHGADVNAQGGVCGNALQAASSGGHEMIVQILLSRGADVNAQGDYFGNALEAASYGGHEKIVQTLLEHGADINAQGGVCGNALQAASSGGHEKIVQTLLDHSADINAQGGVCGNALQAASSGGHEMIVQILLSRGADVNAQGGYFGNALEAASYGGYEKIVQTLLDHSADINAQGGVCGNALQAASSGGHEMIVQILLSRGADVNAQGGEYSNALQAASYRGHEKVAQTLLDHGADVNAQGNAIYGKALHAASSGGYEKVVHILLDHGADINDSTPYRSALQTASMAGHDKVVHILLDRGADINAPGLFGTALHAASEEGHEKPVQNLLDNDSADETLT